MFGLFAWALHDFLGMPFLPVGEGFLLALLVALTITLLGLRLAVPFLRRVGLGLLVVTYFGAHLIVLSLDATAALGFLTLALFAVELRILAERFVPVYAANLKDADRERVGSALQRGLIRVVAVSGVAFLVSILAADVALAGTLPVTTIPTALLLAAGLIAVVFVLALWPFLERREA